MDWIADKIYWSGPGAINVLDIHTNHHVLLFNTTDAVPVNIIVDPTTRCAIVIRYTIGFSIRTQLRHAQLG